MIIVKIKDDKFKHKKFINVNNEKDIYIQVDVLFKKFKIKDTLICNFPDSAV